MDQPCKVHYWAIPADGDTALTCETCGRVLDRYSEVTPAIRASIVASVEGRRGEEVADRFRAFFGYGPLSPTSDYADVANVLLPRYTAWRRERDARLDGERQVLVDRITELESQLNEAHDHLVEWDSEHD